MISFLVWLLIVLVVFAIIVFIVRQLPIPAPWGNIILAVIALIVLLLLLAQLGVLGSQPPMHWRN